MLIRLDTKQYSTNTNKNLYKLSIDGEGQWKDYKFRINDNYQESDYLVVFEGVDEDIRIGKLKYDSIFIAGESESIKRYSKRFLNQFDHIITCQRNIIHPSVLHFTPGHTWFVNKTYSQLNSIKSIKKSKLLSIVVSNKVFTEGHKKRLDFCLKLKEILGDSVDIFGRGFNEFEDKWDVLAPYKYSIAIENSNEDDWVTEKIGDCFLTHTFPFYFGAPNIDKYFKPKSFELIDIEDFPNSFKKIKKIINDETHYAEHLDSVIDSKYKYINNYTMLPIVYNFIEKLSVKIIKDRKNITIKKEEISFLMKIKQLVKKIVGK